MRCEWPELRRCCFCMPLRFGLLGLGYVKVALDIALLVVILASLGTIRLRSNDHVVMLVMDSFGISYLIVDLVMNALFIYGCHKKDPAMLHVFYRYCIVMLTMTILLALALIIFDIIIFYTSPFIFYMVISSFIIYMTIWTLGIITQIYIIVLVINEVKKLESSRQFQFTNGMDEACAARVEDQLPPIVEVK